ncbi:MAG TPA: non-homologous end-joining DNA ligase [Xanthobacteraceae bacterium]|nr:non-homologous end-joining DNA ligase [Xanthobacteraceae bacterium]
MKRKYRSRSAPARKRAAKSASPRTKHENVDFHLTHPDRVYWQDAGITKLDLAEYYVRVWDWMAPHVVGRVLALVRCPEGAAAECFFQKHAHAGIDKQQLRMVPEPNGDESISVRNLAGVIALVQAGVLEIHTRGTTIDHLEEADRLVFDLDPGPGLAWKDVLAAAREVRRRLEAMGLRTFVKTSGGKGLHVVLPIRYTPWDEAKAFCRGIAEQMAADEPDRYLATAKKSARANRIFVDYLRNSREATAVAPYSTRARAGAPVSVPVAWEELSSLTSAAQYTLRNIQQRLSRLSKDPWAGIGRIKQALPKPRSRR